ncbi:MAG: xanthine dehydrogenase family protein subunit M [Thermoflexus hugenholtzii]|jgi:carbon-monoxide dehydrogenase medium subunit|uniref:FAD binding domain-containing protein n=1 Tax=Thermoflexus TaxID=1495649 RepID=UPI001C759296|nr:MULTISPECIES: xanthine dehydrogenase family protein subunit M [Thermoflexus]MDT7948560.1 xanthine dehydrogenase family protein subunit M [Thermoflexus sp.]QWK10685.1 MAG: xanthine dehydrogenase family protein subunit M [Thermoflexus hugenholtzii]
MFPAPFEYVAPSTLDQAIRLLQQHGPDARLLAGGQSLIPMMRFRLANPRVLIDLHRIPGLDFLEEAQGVLRIGAMVRHRTVERAPLIQQRYPLLADAARVIADPIVRNRGTLGGSIAHADPAGDWGAALLAAKAEVVITGPRGRRIRQRAMPLEEFFVGPFMTALEPGEIVTEIRVPAPGPREAGAYLKIERKVGDFAVVAVGVQIALDADGICRKAGIGLCAVGPTSLRAQEAEEWLVGKRLDEAVIARAGELAAAASQPNSDTRGPAEYKRDMVRVLTIRALRKALERIPGA